MATLFKDYYNETFFNHLSERLKELIPEFDSKKFKKLIFSEGWESMEMKQRMRHTTLTLNTFMPGKFPFQSEIIIQLVKSFSEKRIKAEGVEFLFIPDYIEVFGLNHFEESTNAIEEITKFISCEFAVRPFLMKYGNRMVNKMSKWANHLHENVRRLSSEGSRPRLPWGMALQEFKKDPAAVLPILEKLKNDPSLFVRKSVANHLNDISKDNPHHLLEILKRWKNISPETDWILKHASRTLLKQGNKEVLKHFGIHQNNALKISQIRLHTREVQFGKNLEFSFSLENRSRKAALARIEYAIYFMKSNGELSKKVFKISERKLGAGENILVTKKHKFVKITTRKYYPGKHAFAVILNGEESRKINFVLRMKGNV